MRVELILTAGEEVGRRWALEPGQKLVVGRGAEVQVRLRDPDASREHCEVRCTAAGVEVADLGSRNGTVLAGEKLTGKQARAAAHGDEVRIGAHVLRIAFAAEAPAGAGGVAAGGQTIRERYEVLQELGRGGGGSVFAARHRASGQVVAIKRLHPDLASEPAVRERFLREGQVRVSHPNVVQLHEAVVEGKDVFLVMELIRGGSVEALLERGQPLAIPFVLQVGEQSARGLAALHAARVIHRDVKPANILLADGVAKVGDFGIAKRVGQSVGGLTRTGEGMGTLAYCSPEQAQDAKRIEPTADIYSLGATLFHMLAGRPPFTTPTLAVLVEIIHGAPPPLAGLRPDCPPRLVHLVHSMLAKDPDDRPPEAVMVADALRAIASGRG